MVFGLRFISMEIRGIFTFKKVVVFGLWFIYTDV